jgi:hypothetical protein
VNEYEYQSVQHTLILLAQLIKDLDLDSFLFAIERADMLGPILDPTLYQSGMPKMRDVQRLAKAAKVFQDEVKRQLDANP